MFPKSVGWELSRFVWNNGKPKTRNSQTEDFFNDGRNIRNPSSIWRHTPGLAAKVCLALRRQAVTITVKKQCFEYPSKQNRSEKDATTIKIKFKSSAKDLSDMMIKHKKSGHTNGDIESSEAIWINGLPIKSCVSSNNLTLNPYLKPGIICIGPKIDEDKLPEVSVQNCVLGMKKSVIVNGKLFQQLSPYKFESYDNLRRRMITIPEHSGGLEGFITGVDISYTHSY
eukprot:142531_1